MRSIASIVLAALLWACGGGDETEPLRLRAPSPPRRLTAAPAPGAVAIDLAWLPATGATSYRVWRQTQSFDLVAPERASRRLAFGPGASLGRYEWLADVPDTRETAEPHFRDTRVELRTRYYYRVTAVGPGGQSGASNLASAAPLPAANGAPAPTAAPIATWKNTQASTVVAAGDPDAGDGVTFAVTAQAEHGKARISAAGVAVYVPANLFAGSDSFEVTVTDEWGLAGAVKVPVTVANHLPLPGTADLLTLKNMPVGYWLETGDADTGEVFAYGVTTPPQHGAVAVDADGFVTYTPALGYVGADAFALAVTDSSGASAGHALTVAIANSVPRPIALPIVAELNTPGTALILPQDPDPLETWMFQMVTAPTHGTALAGAGGLITYTPDGGYMGPDALDVLVTDGSGAAGYVHIPVTVDQSHLTAGVSFPISAGLCGDPYTRVIITDVSPAAYAELAAGADVPFTITLDYTSPVTQDIGVVLGAYGSAVTSVQPGCGRVTLSAGAYEIWSAFWLEPFPNDAQVAVQYALAGEPRAEAVFTTVALDRGTVIRSPTFEFDARIGYDLFGDTQPWAASVGVESLGGQAGYRAGFFTTVSQATGMPLRLRGALGCGDVAATFQVLARRASPAAQWGYAYLAFAAVPPAVRVDNFLTMLPVTTTPVTQRVGLRACGGATAVTFTTSAPWFAVSPTMTALSAFSDTQLQVSMDPTAVFTYGAPVSGTLRIHPFGGEAFTPIDVPLSMVKFEYDFGTYTRLGLAGADDAAVMADLPWAFPAAGTAFTRVEVTSNGTVNLTGAACMHDWQNILGPFRAGAPGRYGCPVLAPLWADHTFRNGYLPGAAAPDVYVRAVGGGDPHFDILFWDLQSRGRFYTHNVVAVRLYADGRFEYLYPLLQPYGHESVGWWGASGESGPLTYAGAMMSGEVLEFAGLP